MPPKCRFTREEIIQAALDLTAEKGVGALTARGLAQRLGSSAKPIFGLFANMEEVQQEVVKAANLRYQEYLRQDMSAGRYPSYSQRHGLHPLRPGAEGTVQTAVYAGPHPRRKGRRGRIGSAAWADPGDLGLSRDDAYRFHLEMWIYVHGIATMIATAYLEWDMDFISAALTDAYQGLRLRFLPKETEGERK